MKNAVCPRCGSNEIIGEAEVRDYDASSYRPLSVSVRLANPASGLIRKTHESSPLQAWVC